MFQNTVKSEVFFKSVGQHTGENMELTIRPAEVNTGIVFKNKDGKLVNLSIENTFAVMGCSAVGCEKDNIKTIEHLMSVLSSLKIDNCVVDVNGGEMPICDGSGKEFVDKILSAGIEKQDVKRTYIKVLKPVEIEVDGSFAALYPNDFQGLSVDVEIDFPFCGKQVYKNDITQDVFVNEVANCRTFAPMSLVRQMQGQGFVKGASLDTGIGIDDDGTIMNKEGLRCENEFVLHKVLDSIGDLYMLNRQIIGLYKAVKPGHRINNLLCKKLMENKDCFEIVEF